MKIPYVRCVNEMLYACTNSDTVFVDSEQKDKAEGLCPPL